jgi:hypothetical protein
MAAGLISSEDFNETPQDGKRRRSQRSWSHPRTPSTCPKIGKLRSGQTVERIDPRCHFHLPSDHADGEASE